MLTIRLRHRDHTTLFSGDFRTVYEAVETAVTDGVNLDGADLSYLDLREINLDGVRLHDVDFTGANLTGANLSEAVLTSCRFDEAWLYNACLCHSNLGGATFIDTQCGGTDIAGARLSSCTLSGISTLSLNLHEAADLTDAVFLYDHLACKMSHPPVALHGLSYPLVLFDDIMLCGTSLYLLRNQAWQQLDNAPPVPAETQKLLSAIVTARRKTINF